MGEYECECGHDFENTYCPGCGAYLGQTCVRCDMWYDGGDPACQEIQDCTCEVYVWPEGLNLNELVGDYYGTKFQFGRNWHLSRDVVFQIQRAAGWEIRHLLRHKEPELVEGPVRLIILDYRDELVFMFLLLGETFFGAFLAYDRSVYD